MDTIELILAAIVTVALVVYLVHFLARRLSQRLGERAANQSIEAYRHPLIRSNFVLALLLIYLGGYGILKIRSWWPPAWVQRDSQRKEVFRRVESAGGWGRLLAETTVWMATNDPNFPGWLSAFNTNCHLPQSISTLKPVLIEVNPGQITNTVLFHVFRAHRHQPGYALYVTSTKSSQAAIETFRTKFPRTDTPRQITNGVFEVY